MNIDNLKVEYSKDSQGRTEANIRHKDIGNPFWSMQTDVLKTGSVASFQRDIVNAAQKLAAEMTELETGVDLHFDPEAETKDLVEHADIIPTDEWLRRYSLIMDSEKDDIHLEVVKWRKVGVWERIARWFMRILSA